jgi:hypothetical protein
MSGENFVQLCCQRTGRGWTVDGQSPKVAERAREWTLGAGKKNRQRLLYRPIGSAFILQKRSVSRVGIYVRLGLAKAPNSPINSGRLHTTAACNFSKWRR